VAPKPSETDGGRSALPPTSEIVERALAGDAHAYARLARIVTGYLTRWRAYDFQSDWEDIVQEVLISSITAWREGRIETDAAFQAYVRQAARFKFVDRIRASNKVSSGVDAEETLDRDAGADSDGWPPGRAEREEASYEARAAVQSALSRLSDRERSAVLEIHLRGRTYEEAAAVTGIPLGTLKRDLRLALGRLRRVLAEDRDA